MSCKDDGMCKTAAICFLDGCQAEKCTTATTERTNLSHRNHVGTGLRLAEAIAQEQIAAAATTASASEPKAVQIFTCKGKGGEYELIGYSNGAGPKRGESIVVYRRTSEPDVLYHRSAHDFRERMEWLGGRAPSRAADGQQGASRAVLGVLDGLPTYDPERDMPGVMEFRDKYHDGDYYKVEDVRAALARAPLPAPDDARLEVFIDWYLRGGEYAEINPNGHMVRTTREQILEWLDRAAQSRAQSDTTGENHG